MSALPLHRTLLRPLAHSKRTKSGVAASFDHRTGSHGKLRNRVTTWSYRPTDLPGGLDPGIRRRQAQKFSSHRLGAHSLIS